MRLISSPAQHVQLHYYSHDAPYKPNRTSSSRHIRELDVRGLLDVSGLCPLPERDILIQCSDSVPARTLTTAEGIPGTVQGCLDACKTAGFQLGGVEYGG